MISVIVCSRDSLFLESLRKNIHDTIGVEHEIIAIDNSMNRESICSAYNKGGKIARYGLLCFVHEDVCFKTNDWGIALQRHLTDQDTGLIGIAGGDSMSQVPSTWSNSFISNEINIIQRDKKNLSISSVISVKVQQHTSHRKQVLTVDGVFICLRKSIFEQYQFDEVLLKGFHGYDVDYSLQLAGKFKNYVVHDILLEHFSGGSLDIKWLESTFLIAEKWKNLLPLSIYKLSDRQLMAYHWQSLHVLLRHMFKLRYPPEKIYIDCLRFSFTKFFTARRFLSMNKLFFQLLSANRRLVNSNTRKVNVQLTKEGINL